jgi:protein involved in polysaccharide export with SLBB domain
MIARAGGLTQQAYPLGAVFTRVRVREQEAKTFERLALDLESGLAETLSSGAVQRTSSNPAAIVASVQELANRLRTTTPVGRVVVEADPTVLGVSPELDTILEPGDTVLIPKRPNYVSVSGEVLRPGTIQFRAGKTVDQYIDGAGGISRLADDGRTFVVLPNGEAQRVAVSAWNYTSVHLPPGSTIIVPRDPKPFDWTTFSITMTEILSKLAITAASLSIISSN